MKLRIEPLGYHYFDRETGLHFLLDEIVTSEGNFSIAPRTLSLAITNACNLNCSFCHIKKGSSSLSKEVIVGICKEFDRLGTFDVAIGGGEPFMHKDLVGICKAIWNETSLGISITTNGSLINEELISDLKQCISFLRISIDSADQNIYNKIRNSGIVLIENNLTLLKDTIPFGINAVINSQTIFGLDQLLNFAIKYGAEELLLLPEIYNNEFTLTKKEWNYLENWIQKMLDVIPLRIIDRARKEINIPTLFDDHIYLSDYKYVDVEMNLKDSSYDTDFVRIDLDNIERVLRKWRCEDSKYN